MNDSLHQSFAIRSRQLLVGAGVLSLLLTLMPAFAQRGSQPATAGNSTNTPAESAGASSEGDNSAGAKGAKTYCYMRSEGNTHKVSWDAAYAQIKRQSRSLFKTSPEHAAVMITEAVVNNPGTYPDCGKYLGNLFAK